MEDKLISYFTFLLQFLSFFLSFYLITCECYYLHYFSLYFFLLLLLHRHILHTNYQVCPRDMSWRFLSFLFLLPLNLWLLLSTPFSFLFRYWFYPDLYFCTKFVHVICSYTLYLLFFSKLLIIIIYVILFYFISFTPITETHTPSPSLSTYTYSHSYSIPSISLPSPDQLFLTIPPDHHHRRRVGTLSPQICSVCLLFPPSSL